MKASRWLYASVALIAAAALAYQLLLLRLLAIVQWSVLAGTVVSLALLGHGASGTLLALLRRRALAHARMLYVACAAAFAASTIACFALAQQVPFNALELIWDWRQWPQLAVVYSLLALPFLFAASCFGLAFMRHGDAIPGLYGADLAGAAAGAGALTLALWWVPPESALRGVAWLALAGAAAALPRGVQARKWTWPALALGVALVAAVPSAWIAPRPSEYKGEQRLLAVMGAERIDRAWSPYGTLSVVASPQVPLRHAPGLSLQALAEPPAQLAIFTDADALTVVTDAAGPLPHLGQMTSALPYRLLDRPGVLVLNSGGGEAVLQALSLGAASVTAVEPDPRLLTLVRERLAKAGGAVYGDPRVRARAGDPRAHLRADLQRYDLIHVAARDSAAGAAAGALATAEAYLYTVEAVVEALQRLDDGGLLAYTRWERLPPRDGVKLFATVVAALRHLQVDDPGARIAMIRSWQTTTLIVKNGRFDAAELDALQTFCSELAFDPVHFPGIDAAQVNRHHRTPRPLLYEATQALLSPHAEAFVRDYKFDVAPVHDDRPFFFQFLKWRTIPELLRLRGQGGVALLDTGYLMTVATAAQAVLFSVLLIGVPLLWLRTAAGAGLPLRSGVYFAALGLAFLFIEIAWLHRLVLLLGHPLLAASAGLAAFLLFAGLGSIAAEPVRRRFAHAAIALVVGVLVVWLLALEIVWLRVLDASPGWALPARVLVAVMVLAPAAFCMGMPFPLGLARVSAQAPALVPWAWGINGCLSVCAAAFASLLAMHFGFQAVLLTAAALYVLAAATLH